MIHRVDIIVLYRIIWEHMNWTEQNTPQYASLTRVNSNQEQRRRRTITKNNAMAKNKRTNTYVKRVVKQHRLISHASKLDYLYLFLECVCFFSLFALFSFCCCCCSFVCFLFLSRRDDVSCVVLRFSWLSSPLHFGREIKWSDMKCSSDFLQLKASRILICAISVCCTHILFYCQTNPHSNIGSSASFFLVRGTLFFHWNDVSRSKTPFLWSEHFLSEQIFFKCICGWHAFYLMKLRNIFEWNSL